MAFSYRRASSPRPPGTTFAYTEVQNNIKATGMFDAFRMKRKLVGLLRREGFSKVFLSNSFKKNGTVVTCRTNLFELDTSHRMEFNLKTNRANPETDKLVDTIDHMFHPELGNPLANGV
jgi:hypothetical protein